MESLAYIDPNWDVWDEHRSHLVYRLLDPVHTRSKDYFLLIEHLNPEFPVRIFYNTFIGREALELRKFLLKTHKLPYSCFDVHEKVEKYFPPGTSTPVE